MKTVESSLDLGIAEPILLQHFRDGLGQESAVFLDSSSGGSFAHLTLSKCKDILGKILENTPYSGVFDEFPDEEEEPMPNTLSEPKPIEEEPIFPTIQSVEDCTPLTKTWFTNEPFHPYREFDYASSDFVYEYYDELFDKHWIEKSFSRRERDSRHEGEELLKPNPEAVERRRKRLEYVYAISSREWLRETEVMDQVIQLYPELKLLSCQVGNLSYQDVFYDLMVGINIIPKSLVLEDFPDEPLSFSQKHLRWILGQTIKTEGTLELPKQRLESMGSS
jgi:hypothetical protein